MTTGRQAAQSEYWVGGPEWVWGRWPRVSTEQRGTGQAAQSGYRTGSPEGGRGGRPRVSAGRPTGGGAEVG